jgi:peptidoglycan hydrolase-like protein with peptidoglycan-binding domain
MTYAIGEHGPELSPTGLRGQIVERAFTESLHPRDAGKFAVAPGSGNKTVKPTATAAAGKGGKGKGKGGAAGKKAAGADKGSLSFDGKRGAGYGTPGGDKRVHSLQQALNKLGLTDASGAKLKDDGKLGPKTTAAIKKAQRAMGLKADGVVTPAILAKLSKAKSLKDLKPMAKKAAPAKKVPAVVKPAHAPVRSGKSSTAPKAAPVSYSRK